jgi:molecular chaperone GrpE
VTKKPKLTEPGITQADGIKEVPEVLDNADTAGNFASPDRDGRRGEVLPMEPAEEKARRLEGELENVKEQHLRLAAEFDNFKKRVARERTETADRAQAAVVVKMLAVLDDLDRLVSGEDHGQGPVFDATVLIHKKFKKELEAAGLESIDPTGQPFDPKVHEAVSTVPPPDPSKDHIVAATFQTGYGFKGNLIRPAMVQVYSDPGPV